METKMTRFGIPVLRLLAGGLFVIPGVLKAADPGAFLKAVENYRILPHALAVGTAFYLPWLEIVCGTGVISRRLRAGALGLLILLMLVFMVALVSAWSRGLNIDCGCFGSDGDGPAHYGRALTRDVFILAVLCFLEAASKFGGGAQEGEMG